MTGTNVGPYCGVSRDEQITLAGRTFRLLIYGAYNAGGLIGPECNGIAVLDEDNQSVLLDEHAKAATGYFGATPEQQSEFDRIKAMSPAEFAEFVNAHPRHRCTIELPEKRRIRKARKFGARAYITLARSTLAYNAEAKAQFLSESHRLAQIIAAGLGLNEDQYDIRVNPGGIAVSGDVVLHTDTLYVNLSQTALGPDQGFMYRPCKGRQDYTGGANRWMKWEALLDLPDAIATLRAAATPPAPPA